MNELFNTTRPGIGPIAWYGIIMAVAMLTAFGVSMFLGKKKGYNLDVGYHLMFIIIPVALLGARVLFVAYNPGTPFFAFRDGGIALMGGIGFSIIALWVYCRIRKVGFFTLCDFIVVGLILGQVIGRWANIINQELLGWVVSGGPFPFVQNVHGIYHLNTNFLESMMNLAGFAFLFWFFTRKQTKWGQTTALYFIWYGTTRAILEPLRLSPDLMFGSSTIVFNQANFIIALLLILAGCVILFLNHKGLISQENAALLLKKEDTDEPTQPPTGGIRPELPSDTKTDGDGEDRVVPKQKSPRSPRTPGQDSRGNKRGQPREISQQ